MERHLASQSIGLLRFLARYEGSYATNWSQIDRPFASSEYRQGLIRLDSKVAAGVLPAVEPGRMPARCPALRQVRAQCR